MNYRSIPILGIAVCMLFLSCKSSETSTGASELKIAFGSCNKHDAPQPLWAPILKDGPDVWIWLGDNIYGDTPDMELLASKYAAQNQIPAYANLKAQTSILGIWDDHDYGINDGGKNFAQREKSQQILFDFLDTPADAPERSRAGAYSSHLIGSGKEQVKVILLDARYFRDTLMRVDRVYQPNEDGTILGEEQWSWLEKELSDDRAAVTLIGSGIQMLPTQHPYEKWANFPKERERLLDLLAKTKVKNPVLLSGDRHIAEIMKLEDERFPNGLYEITSSGLTHTWSTVRDEPNDYRIDELIAKLNYGLATIDWNSKVMTFQIKGEEGKILATQNIQLQ
ncbi:alkaline phosphatase D family protein [Algoriphagus namhaensis]